MVGHFSFGKAVFSSRLIGTLGASNELVVMRMLSCTEMVEDYSDARKVVLNYVFFLRTLRFLRSYLGVHESVAVGANDLNAYLSLLESLYAV